MNWRYFEFLFLVYQFHYIFIFCFEFDAVCFLFIFLFVCLLAVDYCFVSHVLFDFLSFGAVYYGQSDITGLYQGV